MKRKGILVINKIDRLLTMDLPFMVNSEDPSEEGPTLKEVGEGLERASDRIRRLIENVNACVGVIVNSLNVFRTSFEYSVDVLIRLN